MKCTKFLGKRKYLFLCYSKGNNFDTVRLRTNLDRIGTEQAQNRHRTRTGTGKKSIHHA
jgi:hypothetical protein